MTAASLIDGLVGRGVTLSRHGEKLRVDAPAGVLSPELRATLAGRKPEVLAVLDGDWEGAALALLAAVPDPERRTDLRYQFEERAGVCEFSGGMPRGEAERAAYEEIAAAVEGSMS